VSNPLNDPELCIQRCEDCARTLNEIAERLLSGDSSSLKAIAFAKNALLFIATRRCAEFELFLQEMSRGLSSQKKAELRRLGIETDGNQ